MRLPARSEPDAFRLTVATVVATGIAVLVGWALTPWAGVAVFAVLLAGCAVAYLRAENPDRRRPLAEAAHEAHAHEPASGRRHILVVANDTLGDDRLRERLVGCAGQRPEVDILAPVLTSRIHEAAADIDAEIAQAHERLERSLAWARAQGIAARGEVGDADPDTALEDELRDFGADEVIVVSRPGGERSWQEDRELSRLRAELDVPVTQLIP